MEKNLQQCYEWETLSTDTLNHTTAILTELEEWYENGAYLEGVDGKKFVDDIKATRPTLTEAEKTYADNTGHILWCCHGRVACEVRTVRYSNV